MNTKSIPTNGLEWSVASSVKEGEKECGDTYLIKEFDGKVLLAAVDGLGHGKKAFEARDALALAV